MNFNNLCIDIIIYLCTYLSNSECIQLLSTSTYLHSLKNKIWFNDSINIKFILKLSYRDRFRSLIITNTDYSSKINETYIAKTKFQPVNATSIFYNYTNSNYTIPSITTHLTLTTIPSSPIPNSVKHIIFGPKYKAGIRNIIPYGVQSVTFGTFFDNVINKGEIPQSVTHLTFGLCFNKSIVNSIPNSVTHLTFGCLFNKSIDNNIPDSVQHLVFGDFFNQDVTDSIPSSVKYLTLGHYFNHDISKIPNTVQYLTLDKYDDDPIRFKIPSTVISVIFLKKKIV